MWYFCPYLVMKTPIPSYRWPPSPIGDSPTCWKARGHAFAAASEGPVGRGIGLHRPSYHGNPFQRDDRESHLQQQVVLEAVLHGHQPESPAQALPGFPRGWCLTEPVMWGLRTCTLSSGINEDSQRSNHSRFCNPNWLLSSADIGRDGPYAPVFRIIFMVLVLSFPFPIFLSF